jgi:NAD(P)-dependent dehydrogenase (short-subunit alcohol dehydrogenase family)
MENLFDLTGEVAVIVGATGVLGGALASGLAASGAVVAVLGRDKALISALPIPSARPQSW